MIPRFKSPKRMRSPRRIEIYLDRVEQLFNSMDPSPFQEKDLDHDAEEFIVSWAQEFHRREPLMLRIHLRQFPEDPETPRLIEKAVRNYFSYRWNLNQLEFKRLMKQGRTSLFIGGLFLAACLFASDLLGHGQHGPLLNVLRESLTIGGWVGMWRPLQIFLYDWWPLRRTGEIYRRLSHSPVELRKPSPTRNSHPQVSRT
jgi:hypothetical protein